MGHEKTLTALLPALAGANVIYGLGNTETGVTMDYGQMVMDNELAEMVKFTLQGIPVNDETLAGGRGGLMARESGAPIV